VTRPDGRKPFIPDVSDNKTPRPNRYVELDFVEPATGVSEVDFEAALSKEINQVLALPGWMAAQRFRHAPTPSTSPRPRLAFTKYLVIWETEGTNAQGLQDARAAAVKAGQIKEPSIAPATAQSSWWATVSPWIDKDDFKR
jgi:hypothetical protein